MNIENTFACAPASAASQAYDLRTPFYSVTPSVSSLSQFHNRGTCIVSYKKKGKQEYEYCIDPSTIYQNDCINEK